MPAPKTSLPDQLRLAIGESGLSCSALGRLAGVDHGQVLRFLQGTDIRLETAGRICAALGLSLAAPARPRGRPRAVARAPSEQD
jgi:hypothetical protein